MKLTPESKILIGIAVVTLVIVGIASLVLTQPTQSLPKADIIGASGHTKGNTNAKAYLVEFSDFQCPACKAAKPIVDNITTQYKDKLEYVYRFFPLDQHPFGMKSALAAEAAGKQGKFWEMYDELFANQDTLSDATIGDIAKKLNLDMEKFNKDITDDAVKNTVTKDRDYGNAIGVNATPTFFLNGKQVNLTSFNDLQTAVSDAIK